MEINKVTISIGKLPEWCNQNMEDTVHFEVKKQIKQQYPPAKVSVEFHYSGENVVWGYDQDGNQLFEMTVDLTSALNKAARYA